MKVAEELAGQGILLLMTFPCRMASVLLNCSVHLRILISVAGPMFTVITLIGHVQMVTQPAVELGHHLITLRERIMVS